MEKRNITISLLVPVYNGMDYWKECVISINEYGYLFDNIIVSINKGESYQEDIETAKTINTDNISLIIQEKKLDAVSHFKNIIKKVNTEYVVILAHDDLLLDGIKELRNKLLSIENPTRVSFLGTFQFFKDAQDIAVVKEIYSGCIKKEEFIEYDLAKHFNLNISGMCLPVKSVLYNLDYIDKFVSGIRYDYLLLTNNEIDEIYQLQSPTVRIRVHNNQQGAIIGLKGRIADSILYFMYHIFNTNDNILKQKLKNELVGTLLNSLKNGTLYGLYFYVRYSGLFISRMGTLNFLKFNIGIFIQFFRKVCSKLVRSFK